MYSVIRCNPVRWIPSQGFFGLVVVTRIPKTSVNTLFVLVWMMLFYNIHAVRGTTSSLRDQSLVSLG